MDERKQRFKEMIEEYDRGSGESLRKLMFFFGDRLKRMNNPFGRFMVSNVTTRLMANMIVKLGLFGVEKRDEMTVEEIALNWLKPSLFFHIPGEVFEVTDQRVVYLRPECTVGFDDPKYCKICRASMNMDQEIIRLLGGKLTVTETILEGAPKCRHIVEKL